MINYSKALIYKITTPNGLYIGSTHNFKQRKYCHKSNIYNENCRKYNCKLYQNIRENDGDWSMEILHLFPCENDIELRQEETRIMLELNANLNERRAYLTEEERMEYNIKKSKKYYEKHRDVIHAQKKLHYEKNRDEISARNQERITCECGCEIRRNDISRHRRTKKHLNRMKLLDDLQPPV